MSIDKTGTVVLIVVLLAAVSVLLLLRASGRKKEEAKEAAEFLRRLGKLDSAEQGALRAIATKGVRAISDGAPDLLAAVTTKAGFLWTEPKSNSFTTYRVDERWLSRLRTWSGQRTEMLLGFATASVPLVFDGSGVSAAFKLAVTNHGSADEFQAQVVACAPGETPAVLPPVTLRWSGGDSESRMIDPGTTEYLEVAQLETTPANPRLRDAAGQPARGVAAVIAYWAGQGCLGGGPYWSSEDFRAQVWSLHILVSSTSTTVSKTAGVRLHLFGRAEDDPTGKMLKVGSGSPRHPTAEMMLFDVAP